MMQRCQTPTKAMLPDPVEVRISEAVVNFQLAKQIADRKAAELAEEPMLLAWFDGCRGEFSPRVGFCKEEEPGWLTYAKSRGGNITIDINDEQYIFIYRGGR